MTKLFLIRHGESEWNKLNIIQGQKDVELTDLGKTQALRLGHRLIDEDIHIIYSSDLLRAFTTAQIISEAIDKPVIPNKELREVNFGDWEGKSIDEIKEKYGEDYEIWVKEPHKFSLPGIENLQFLRERAIKAVKTIVNDNEGKNIAIVSHGAFLKTLILGLLDMDLSHYKNISLNNVSLSLIDFRSYNIVLRTLNDVSHLKGLSK